MSEKERLRLQIRLIREQIEDARNQIRGREYVCPRQSAGVKRLIRDLNERLKVLEREYSGE